jgi:hypothetical protein
MGLIIILPFGVLGAWVSFAITRWLCRGDFGAEWWKAYGIFALAGILLGLWFVLYVNYSVGNAHLEGFPIPYKIASREKPGDAWNNDPIPVPVQAGAVVTDLIYGLVFCLAPLAGAAFIKENRGTADFSDPRDRRPDSRPS